MFVGKVTRAALQQPKKIRIHIQPNSNYLLMDLDVDQLLLHSTLLHLFHHLLRLLYCKIGFCFKRRKKKKNLKKNLKCTLDIGILTIKKLSECCRTENSSFMPLCKLKCATVS